MNDPDDVMEELDGLTAWIEQRGRARRRGLALVLAATGLAAVLALLDDAWLFAPLVPAGAVLWPVGERALDRWYAAGSRRAGHPVVRADVAWTRAARRALPPRWADRGVPGTLHRTEEGWTWRPSVLLTQQFAPLRWASSQVVVATLVPVREPGGGPRAQLRLFLREGGTVELLVRQPARLGPLVPADGPGAG